MTQEKLTFTAVSAARPRKEEDNNKLSITVNSQKIIFFSSSFVQLYPTQQIIRFFVDDEKNALGWRFLKNDYTKLSKLKSREYRIWKKNKSGTVSLQLTRVLNRLKLKEKTYKQLPIKEYNDLIFGKIYYVRFPQ